MQYNGLELSITNNSEKVQPIELFTEKKLPKGVVVKSKLINHTYIGQLPIAKSNSSNCLGYKIHSKKPCTVSIVVHAENGETRYNFNPGKKEEETEMMIWIDEERTGVVNHITVLAPPQSEFFIDLYDTEFYQFREAPF